MGPHPSSDYTCWVMVPPGLRRTVASVTKRPELADRFTERLLPVPLPTRSVVVLPGQRAVAALLTNRPEPALRLTDLATASSKGHIPGKEGRP